MINGVEPVNPTSFSKLNTAWPAYGLWLWMIRDAALQYAAKSLTFVALVGFELAPIMQTNNVTTTRPTSLRRDVQRITLDRFLEAGVEIIRLAHANSEQRCSVAHANLPSLVA